MKTNLARLLGLAIAIVAEGFKNKVDKSGQPMILHCLYVMNKMDTMEEKILGVLHDSVEDKIVYNGTVITIQALRDMGFPEDILQDLILLTHIDGEPYFEVYIKKISTSKRASKAKSLMHALLEQYGKDNLISLINAVDH